MFFKTNTEKTIKAAAIAFARMSDEDFKTKLANYIKKTPFDEYEFPMIKMSIDANEDGITYLNDSVDDFLMNRYYLKDCWGDYVERKPLPKKNELTIGTCIAKDNIYNIIVSIVDNDYQIRKAGCDAVKIVKYDEIIENYEVVRLNPYFGDYKGGEKAFHILEGEYLEVTTDTSCKYEPIGVEYGDFEREAWFTIDGRRSTHENHPIIFNDHYQAKAYFAEMFREIEKD